MKADIAAHRHQAPGRGAKRGLKKVSRVETVLGLRGTATLRVERLMSTDGGAAQTAFIANTR